MRIKFKRPDPRAGLIAQMDSRRGQDFIDAGQADRVKEDGSVQEPAPALPTRDDLDKALAMLPGSNTDADYVVGAMRSFFTTLFTDEDEAKVRSVVMRPIGKPSKDLRVDELKAALEAKGIAIPPGAKQKELVALLDGAA